MDTQVLHDPVLDRFRTAVAETYGARLKRVVLFGSRARGDHREDSDYDIAVFIYEMGGLWEELGPLARIITEIMAETGAVISAKPFEAGGYLEPGQLMHEIRQDGRDI